MKKQLHLLVLLALLIFIESSCSKTTDTEEKKSPAAETKNEIDVLEVIKATPIQPEIEIKLPGDLAPWFETKIYANVKGFVKEIYVDRGSKVRKGELLALLDAPELYSDLNKEKAKVNELKARYKASKNYYQRIFVTSKTQGAVSANELDVALSKMDADSAELSHATSSYESTLNIIEYLRIKAPFDGVISTRGISAGALVGPQHSGSETTPPLFSIEQIDKMRLVVAIPELYTNELLHGSESVFYVSSMPGKKFNAKLARTSDKMESNVRSMLAEWDVTNKNNELKGGMFADVIIPIKRSTPTFFVPISALLKSTQGVYVIKVSDNNEIKWIKVKTGNTFEKKIEVFGAISEGDTLVLQASEQIKEGSVVKKTVDPKKQS